MFSKACAVLFLNSPLFAPLVVTHVPLGLPLSYPPMPEMISLFCWFHGSRIISAASNLVFWTFFRAKACCVVCHSYCFCYSASSMARKKMSKNHIRFDFSQSENRQTMEKPWRSFRGTNNICWWWVHGKTFVIEASNAGPLQDLVLFLFCLAISFIHSLSSL